MSHLSQDEIIAFTAGRADARGAERAYEHLDACEACAERFEAVRVIQADFEGTWSDFLAEVESRIGGPALAASPVATFDLDIRGVLDGSRRLASAALERMTETLGGLAGGLQANFQPAYSGVGDPSAPGEAGKLAERASALCSEGRYKEAVAVLEEASRLDPKTSANARLDLVSEGRKLGEIVVDARRRAVSVLLDPDPLTRGGGHAVILPAEEGAEERRAELRPVEGARYFLAEFEDVPSGPFHLRLQLPGS